MAIPQLHSIQLAAGKKVYFASDFHLGLPNAAVSAAREKRICDWLQSIAQDAAHIYLVGDLFDAWLEYKHAVPKGHVRFLGTLAALRDSGVPITIFTGNHDLWMYGYFKQELNIEVIHTEVLLTINHTIFLVAHGDGLGPGDVQYKVLKKILRHRGIQWLYRWLHPDMGLPLARWFSKSGLHKKEEADTFLGDKEYLVQYCKTILTQQQVDHFIFGHRHQMIQAPLGPDSMYTNLGDWLKYNSYAVYDGERLSLLSYT